MAKFSKKNAIQNTRMNIVIIIEAAFTILTVFVTMIKNDEQINNSAINTMRRRKINNRPGGERDAQNIIYILGIIVVVNKYEIMRKRKSEKIWYSLIN